MTGSEWGTRRVADPVGYVVTFRGKVPFLMAPRATRMEARAYMVRLALRYPEDSILVLSGGSTRARGGPWRYLLANGESEVIHTERKTDAMAVLRHRLRRKILPAGTIWTLEV